MRILKDSNAISKVLARNPSLKWKLCVAFVGDDTSQFLSPNNIEYLVCSPNTAATSINELQKIARKSKVYLRPNLHTKIYLSDQIAIIGSANFSENGLSDHGTHEAAVLVKDPQLLKLVDQIVEKHRRDSIVATKEILKDLKKEQDQTKSRRGRHVSWPSSRNSLRRTFANVWNSDNRYTRFFPIWIWDQEEAPQHTKAESKAKHGLRLAPEVEGTSCALADIDLLGKGDWVLYWYRGLNSPWLPLKSRKPYWQVLVHDPVDLRSVDSSLAEYPYPCTIFSQPPKKSESPPFEIDNVFTDAFREVVGRSRNTHWRANVKNPGKEEHPWIVKRAEESIQLMDEVNKMIRSQ